MTTQRWEVGPILGRAWQLFRDHAGVILGAMIAMAIINGAFSGVASGLRQLMGASDSGLMAMLYGGARAGVSLASWAVSVFLTLGLIRLLLNAVRGTGPQIADLFAGGRHLVPGMVASILVGLGVLLGCALFLVPGVILGLGWMYTQVLIVDRELGPVEAMQESWRLTRGEKGGLFLWSLVCLGTCLAGFMACGVGLLVAVPVCGLGTVLIYEDLSNRVDDPATEP